MISVVLSSISSSMQMKIIDNGIYNIEYIQCSTPARSAHAVVIGRDSSHFPPAGNVWDLMIGGFTTIETDIEMDMYMAVPSRMFTTGKARGVT